MPFVALLTLLAVPSPHGAWPSALGSQAETSSLLDALREGDEDVRSLAAWLLSDAEGASVRPAENALRECLRNRDETTKVRGAAAASLASLAARRSADGAVADLFAVLVADREDWRLRASCAEALFNLQDGAVLARLVRDHGKPIRVETGRRTIAFDSRGRDLQALSEALGDADARVRRLARLAIRLPSARTSSRTSRSAQPTVAPDEPRAETSAPVPEPQRHADWRPGSRVVRPGEPQPAWVDPS